MLRRNVLTSPPTESAISPLSFKPLEDGTNLEYEDRTESEFYKGDRGKDSLQPIVNVCGFHFALFPN
jgi:hypothetical protein